MRASRLVSFLLVLQTPGQLTAAELAELLEVSRANCAARRAGTRGGRRPDGFGPGTGRRLPPGRGYRTKLTGLDAAEAEALLVGAGSRTRARPGAGRGAAEALASLPVELQERAGLAARLFHVDTRGWFREEDRVSYLAVIAGALWRGRRLDIRYREGPAVVSRRLDPLGLILKAGFWYLLARRRGRSASIGCRARGARPARATRADLRPRPPRPLTSTRPAPRFGLRLPPGLARLRQRVQRSFSRA